MGGACSPFEQQRVFSHPRCRGHPSICDCCGIKYLFKFPFVTVPFMTNIVQIMGKGPSPYLSAALIKNNWKHLREVSREDPSLRWWSVVNSRSSPVMNLSVAGLFEWKKRVMWCEINAVKRKYLCPSLIWCLAWTDDISNLNCLATICLKPGTRTCVLSRIAKMLPEPVTGAIISWQSVNDDQWPTCGQGIWVMTR